MSVSFARVLVGVTAGLLIFATVGCPGDHEAGWWCATSSASSGPSCSCYYGGERAASEHPGVTYSKDTSCSLTTINNVGDCCLNDSYQTCDCSSSKRASACSHTVSACNPPNSSAPSSSGSSGSGSGTSCPAKPFTTCNVDTDCKCTGTCAALSTSDATRYCTVDCTTDADCAKSSTWHGSASGCNPKTHVCTP